MSLPLPGGRYGPLVLGAVYVLPLTLAVVLLLVVDDVVIAAGLVAVELFMVASTRYLISPRGNGRPGRDRPAPDLSLPVLERREARPATAAGMALVALGLFGSVLILALLAILVSRLG